MNRKSARLMCTAFIASSQIACVQENAAKPGANDENSIIVTARRKDEALQDVPQTVNAVASETIQKLRINNAGDIAQLVPGVSIEGSSSGSGALLANNSLNTKQVIGVNPVAPVSSGYQQIAYTPRREFGLQVRYSFGSR
jgi:outer membrane receptor for ferrienterochelin and colicin